MNCLLSSRASAFGSGLTCKSCRFTGQSSINLHLLKCQTSGAITGPTRFGVALGVEINRSSCVFFSLSFRTWKARCKTLAITPLIYTWHFALSWSVFFLSFSWIGGVHAFRMCAVIWKTCTTFTSLLCWVALFGVMLWTHGNKNSHFIRASLTKRFQGGKGGRVGRKSVLFLSIFSVIPFSTKFGVLRSSNGWGIETWRNF